MVMFMSLMPSYCHQNKTNEMKKITVLLILVLAIWSCSNAPKDGNNSSDKKEEVKKAASKKGIGEIKNVKLNDPLNEEMVKGGEAIYQLKCAACHKLSAKRVVGPGFEGVTKKRTPEWIMNMITNVDVMLDEDPEARKLLEECLTRMPNQNVSVEEARDILEFLYKNDADRGVE